MQFSLKHNLNRISHHDAHVTNISNDGRHVIIFFDWGYIGDYGEIGDIVIGENQLILTHVSAQHFFAWEKAGRVEIEKPVLFESLISLVSTNDFEDVGDGFIFKLGGLLEPPIDHYYVEWEVACKTIELQWERFITEAEWKSGAIP